jgi:hypothetical protein
MKDKEVKPKRVFLRTFGWPMGTVAHDDFGHIKEAK